MSYEGGFSVFNWRVSTAKTNSNQDKIEGNYCDTQTSLNERLKRKYQLSFYDLIKIVISLMYLNGWVKVTTKLVDEFIRKILDGETGFIINIVNDNFALINCIFRYRDSIMSRYRKVLNDAGKNPNEGLDHYWTKHNHDESHYLYKDKCNSDRRFNENLIESVKSVVKSALSDNQINYANFVEPIVLYRLYIFARYYEIDNGNRLEETVLVALQGADHNFYGQDARRFLSGYNNECVYYLFPPEKDKGYKSIFASLDSLLSAYFPKVSQGDSLLVKDKAVTEAE